MIGCRNHHNLVFQKIFGLQIAGAGRAFDQPQNGPVFQQPHHHFLSVLRGNGNFHPRMFVQKPHQQLRQHVLGDGGRGPQPHFAALLTAHGGNAQQGVIR